MSKNAFTEEQSKEIYGALMLSSDVEKTLVGLADKYFKEPKNLKNFLAKKYPKEYNKWFGTSVKEDSNKLKLNELVERLLDILDYPEEKQEKVRIYMKGRAFPYEFAEELYVQLVASKLQHLIERMEGHHERFQNYIKVLRVAHGVSTLMLFLFIGLILTVLTNPGLSKSALWDMGDTLIFGLIPVKTFTIIALSITSTIPFYLFWLQRKLFKQQSDEYKQLASAYRKYEEIRDSLPGYIMFENLREYWRQAERYDPHMFWISKKPRLFKFKG